MRKIFLDCGAHDGCSVRMFEKIYDDKKEYEVYSFEGSTSQRLGSLQKYHQKNCYKFKKNEVIPKLVWIFDGKVSFNGWNQSIKQFSSVDTPNTGFPAVVESLDFSKWIKDNFNKDDYIVLKMDIEGAEYEVLNKMIKDGTMSYINKFYGELHGLKKGFSVQETNTLIDKINNKYNLKVWNWDAQDELDGKEVDPYKKNEFEEVIKIEAQKMFDHFYETIEPKVQDLNMFLLNSKNHFTARIIFVNNSQLIHNRVK